MTRLTDEQQPTDCMVYVAADPDQPGAAYAICVDKPEFAKDNAKCIAKWIRDGANVLRVDRATGIAMLDKWERPQTGRLL